MEQHEFADLDDIAAAVSWADARLLPLGPMVTPPTFTTYQLGEFIYAFTHLRSDVAAQSATNPLYMQFTLPISRSATWNIDGQAFRNGLVHVALPGTLHVACISAGARALTVVLPRDRFVDRCLSVFGKKCIARLRSGIYSAREAPLRRATRVASIAFHFAGLDPDLARNPVISELTNDFLMEELIALTCTAGVPRPNLRSLAFRRLIDGVQDAYGESAAEDPTIAELCAALHVSGRTLRSSFQAIYGTSPGRYLRLRRLHRAQRDLKAADPARETVASIAMRHGFSDLGRFAGEYRSLFGEYPSRTLAGHVVQ